MSGKVSSLTHMRAHARKDAWFEVTVVRTNLMPTIPGGVSGLFHKLAALFFSDDGRDFSMSGCQVKLPNGESRLIFCDIAIAIADEAALHAMYACKGTSGLKPCLLCTNVYNRKVDRLDRNIVLRDATKSTVYHTEEDIDRCTFATTDVILAICDRLKAQHAVLGVTKFRELETKLGWKLEPDAVMFCEKFNRRLSPARIAVYDGCHILFVNGIFNHHAGHFLRSVKAANVRPAITPEVIGDYAKLWNFPTRISSAITPSDAFGEARLRSSMKKGELKCTASEGLSLVPVIAQYCESLNRHPSPVVRLHAQLFLDFADIVNQLMRSNRKLMDKAETQSKVTTYITDYKATYGADEVFPKFHQLGHLSKYAFDQLPFCFVHERKHKTIKKYANPVFNTSHDWDASILREVTCQHIERMAGADSTLFSESAGLVHPHAPSRRMRQSILAALGDEFAAATLMTSRHARVNKYEHASIGDIVLVGHDNPPIIGRIVFHISVKVDELVELVSLVDEFTVLEVQNRAWKCRGAGTQTFIDMSDIVCCLTYAGTDVLTVLKPLVALPIP